MREEILASIRKALGPDGSTVSDHSAASGTASGNARAAAQVDSDAQPTEDPEQAIKQFETELKSVGGNFFVAERAELARDYVLQLARSHGARSAIAWDCPIIQDIGLVKALEEAGLEFIADIGSDEFPKQALEAGIGISGVDYALADTGSLVVLSGPGHARSVSLVPPVHVALVKPEQVLSDLNDLFPLLKARGSVSSAIAFITGPSRTADIEMTLVVGVHGPQQLHVILLRHN